LAKHANSDSNDVHIVTSLAPVPTKPPHRLVYFGTPAMAVPSLVALVEAGYEIPLVITRIDKRRGRGGAMIPSPVKVAALERGLAVSHRVDDCLTVGADLGVVVAFGQLIKPHVLAHVPMVNIHFSLLPRWRGAAPVERAILAGDATTGTCLMRLEEGLDTGQIFDVVEVPIDSQASVQHLRATLVSRGTEQLLEQLRKGLGSPRAQFGEVSYAAKLRPEEFEIDWARPALEINRLVRLGVAWTLFRGRRLKILMAEVLDASTETAAFAEATLVGCGLGSLRLLVVQPEGKAPMDATSWANGARPVSGEEINEMSI
jgi:methionyl-tRNA formyltransferase